MDLYLYSGLRLSHKGLQQVDGLLIVPSTVFNLLNLDNFNMLYSGYRTCTTVIQPLLHVLLCYCILVAGEQLLHRGDGTLLLVPRSPPWSHLQTCAGEDGSWGRREHNSTANQNQYQVQ